MSRSVFLCVEALVFEIVRLLSIIEENMNKNPIWSILVFGVVSLYLLPMESSVIEAIYDTLRVVSKWETDIRWHFDTNCWILIIIAHYNINIILVMICYKLRFAWEVYCKLVEWLYIQLWLCTIIIWVFKECFICGKIYIAHWINLNWYYFRD